jgi:type I restriction enzyme, S subunit
VKEGWQTKRLGDVATLQRGFDLPTQNRVGGEFPLVSSSGISDTHHKSAVRGPGVVTGRSGSIGGVFFIDEDFWPLNTVLYVKDFHGNDPKFVFHLLKKFDLQRFASGAGVPTLNRNFVHDELVSVPPFSEQRHIVAILDEAFEGISTAVANSEKNLANARELFENATVTSLFGDPVIQGWRLTSVENIAAAGKGNIRTGPFGSQLLHGEFVDEGIAVLGIDNAVDNEFRWAKRRFVTHEKYAELSRYTVKPGDVLITIMGTCGRCAIVPDDIPLAINSKHLCCITLNRAQCLPDFLHAYFLYHPVARSFLASRAKGSIMEGLNMGIIKELPVWLPDLQAQMTIVSKIELLRAKVLRIQAIYEEKLQILSELKESILEKAFAGELTAQPAGALREAAAA